MKRFIPLIIGLALTLSVQAQQSGVTSSVMDFSGGINTYQPSIYLQPNESPDESNVVIDEPLNALTQRKGYLKCGDTPSGATATNLYTYSKNDGSKSLIVTDNVSVWSTPDCVQFSTIVTGLQSLALPRFSTILDKLWIVNGSTWPITWDGTIATYLDGTSGKPLAPKGRYISYWKSRVWIADTTVDPSGVFFTALTDTSGNALNPGTDPAAWSNTNNLIYFNRDDGGPIYGIRPYRDNMYVFKESGISRLIFESEYNLSVAKNVTPIGCKSNESIVETDDSFLRFVGRDGVYAFDGSTVKRLSTKWTNIFESLNQPTMAEAYKTWDTQLDWGAGTFSGISSTTSPGSLVLAATASTQPIAAIPLWSQNNCNLSFTNSGGHQHWAGNVGNICTNAIYNSALAPYGTYSVNVTLTGHHYPATRFTGQSHTIPEYEYVFLADAPYLGSIQGYSVRFTAYDGNTPQNFYQMGIGYRSGGFSWIAGPLACQSAGGVLSGTLSITRSTDGLITASMPGCTALSVVSNTWKYTGGYTVNSVATEGNTNAATNVADLYGFITSSGGYVGTSLGTGTWISQPVHASGLTMWKTLDTQQSLNGQTLDFGVRTATTSYNLSLKPWRVLTPGAGVSTSSDSWVQIISTFTTTSILASPSLDQISLSWIIGGVTKSPLTAINYKSRYWMSASSTTGGVYNDLVMIESKSPIGTWTRFDLPLSAVTLWNNILYGSISNTAKIARLDYGDNDDGTAITSYWSTRDEIYGNPIAYKTVNKLIVDYSRTPLNTGLQIGLSPTQGSTWQYRTLDTTQAPTARFTKNGNFDANVAPQFRAQIRNSSYDQGFLIYGIHSMGNVTTFTGSN